MGESRLLGGPAEEAESEREVGEKMGVDGGGDKRWREKDGGGVAAKREEAVDGVLVGGSPGSGGDGGGEKGTAELPRGRHESGGGCCGCCHG